MNLGSAVTVRPKFRHLGFAFADGAGTLLKPLAWQGDISFGPSRNGRATFQSLDGNRAGRAYQTSTRLDRARWRPTSGHTGQRRLTCSVLARRGLGAGRQRIKSWIAGLGERLAVVDVDGESVHLLREDLDELAATPATNSLRLLAGYDQWVLGPGTADAHIVPPTKRTLVSRGANILIVGGVVAATWSLTDDQIVTAWFGRARPPEREALEGEVARIAKILNRPLKSTVQTT